MIALSTHPIRTLSKLAILIAGFLLATPMIEAARADAAQVTVVSPGGAQQTISLDALAGKEDVVDREYVLRTQAGESRQSVTGFSISSLIDAAGADPYAFSYLEVQRPAGGSVLLSRDQALKADAFADGPPVVYATTTGTGFLRPSTGSADLNATDSFEAPQGIAITLRKGTPLKVTATASTEKTKPGKVVTFAATVAGAGAGEAVNFSWYFDDGKSATGPNVSHKFAKRGSYDVVVGVTTAGNKTGASAVVTVQVGEPGEGPDRKGGGTNKNENAPDHGAAEGDGGAGQGTESPGLPGPATSPGFNESAPTPAPAQPRKQRPQPTVPAGEEVSGLLLSSSETPLEEPKPAPSARTGKLSADDDGSGPGLPGTAIGLMVTVGLLGAGALVESRNLLR